jgi:hypothetical protein
LCGTCAINGQTLDALYVLYFGAKHISYHFLPAMTLLQRICVMSCLFQLTEAISFTAVFDFFEDYLDFSMPSQPTFLITDESHFYLGIDKNNYYSCIYYESGDVEGLSRQLIGLQESNQHNIVFFVDDGHNELLKQLDKTKNFFSSSIISIMKRNQYLNLTIQFNTKIIFYGIMGNEIGLEEDFRISSEKAIRTNTVGNWKVDGGLTICPQDMWLRRSNLHGRNFLVCNSPIT